MWFANGRTGSLTRMKKGFMAFHFNWVESATSTPFSFNGTELTLHHWATNGNNSLVVTGLNVNMTPWEEIKWGLMWMCVSAKEPPPVRKCATTVAEKPCAHLNQSSSCSVTYRANLTHPETTESDGGQCRKKNVCVGKVWHSTLAYSFEPSVCMKAQTLQSNDSHHVNINRNSSSFVLFLPPSLEWGLGDKACARLHTARSALRRSPSSGSRCPGLRPELLTLAVQSPGERSTHLLGVKRSPGAGMTTGPGAKPHHRRAEGTPGPLPVLTIPRDHRQSRIRRLRCLTGKGQTHRRRHLGEKQRESPCEGGAQGRLCDRWIITN